MTEAFDTFVSNQDKSKPDISLINLCSFIDSNKDSISGIETDSKNTSLTIARKFPVVLNKKELYHHVHPKFSTDEYISYIQGMNDSYKNMAIPNFEPTKTIPDSFNNSNFLKFQNSEIAESIKKRSSNQSKDRYGISFNLFNNAVEKYEKLIPFLADSFNKIMSLSKSYTLHNDWCVASIYTRYKGGDENDPSRYRPLTCLPVVVRIFESILSKKIHDMCLMFDIVDKNVQKAVLKESSGLWENRFEVNFLFNRAKKVNTNDIFAFIDFANAFGSVNYKNLIYILKKCNFSDNIIEYLVKYYANIHGVYKDTKFKWTNGLIQGSSLSNILFLIYIDFVSKNLINEMKMMKFLPDSYQMKNGLYAFVDDFLMVLPNDEKNSDRFMFIDLFAKINGLSINFDKSNFFTFDNNLEKILFGGKELKRTPSNFKYLGMNLIIFEDEFYQDLSITLNNTLCQIDSMNVENDTKFYVFYQNILTRILPHLEIFYTINGYNDNINNIFFMMKYFFARWSLDIEYDVTKQICNNMLIKFISKISKSSSLKCYQNNFPTDIFNISVQDQEIYNVDKYLKGDLCEGYNFVFQKEIPSKDMLNSDFDKIKNSKSFPKINFDKLSASFYGNNFIEFTT